LAVSAILIVIFAYDWLYMEIPSIVLGSGVILAVAFNLWADNVSFLSNTSTFSSLAIFEGLTYSGTLAAFLSFIFFFFLVAVSREKWMGMGDAYLVIFLGLILGWPKIILAIFLSFFIGSVFGIALIIIKKKKLKSRVPFAPFLILGTIITLFFYNLITQWYFSLFY
jgi:prepilin signal peptidase PulO-like enzyme (type II secretory pathway)